MNVRIVHLTVLASIIALASACPVQAGLLLQPTGASTNMGSGTLSPTVTIDQAGLSAGYTSLVTDFDDYISTNPTHNLAPANNWLGLAATGNFDFNLGGSFTIQSFALWNWGEDDDFNVIGFTLLADDNAAFSSPTVLGNFTADPNTGSILAVLPEVFGFTPTEASFVRMQITSNNGNPNSTGFGEAAFEVQSTQAVPEPSSLAMFAVGGVVCLAGAAWRRRRKANPTAA